MYIHSVKLTNFKSIGDYPESEIILEPKVTAIIGKNESGKSNILDGMSRIRFRARNNVAFATDIVNRSCANGQENEFIIILKSTVEDKALGIVDDTTIKITKNSYEATGGILNHILQMVQPDIDSIILKESIRFRASKKSSSEVF